MREEETERILLSQYERYYRLAYSYLQNSDDALDAVQESAFKAIRDCRQVENGDYLATWIYRIVVNTSLDMLRRRRREVLGAETVPQADENGESGYREADLRALLDGLDEKSRTVVTLRYFEDLKLEEIARVTGENVNTVKARLYRALRRLREFLQGDAGAGDRRERAYGKG